MNTMMLLETDYLALVSEPDLIAGFIERGRIDPQKMEEHHKEWVKFSSELALTWPPSKVKTWYVEELRKRYVTTKKQIAKLELKDKDSRSRGVSYKARKLIHRQIEVGKEILLKITAQAEEAKKTDFDVLSYVQPLDMPYIEREGVEKHLEYAIFGYPQALHKPIVLSPVKADNGDIPISTTV